MKTVLTLVLGLFLAMGAMGATGAAGAFEIGEDGLHKETWMSVTFKDMAEDLAAAKEQGKRLAIIFEQRGCGYCREMHEVVFADPKIADYIAKHFMVVQINLFGDEEVTDFDGEAMAEKDIAKRWNVIFTPTILFMPENAPAEGTAAQAAVAVMPGAFGKGTTLHMFEWVVEKGYETDEHFQKYHARKLAEEQSN